MSIYELAALGAASCWAVTGIIAAIPAGHLGAFTFNCLRQIIVSIVMVGYVLITGAWEGMDTAVIVPLLMSGLIGIFIGDTLLFAALNRVGPRRSGILFSMSAPMAVLLGWLVLDETLSLVSLIGIVLIVFGVILAIVYGKRKSQLHQWEIIKGPLWIGVTLGLCAAMGQAVGTLIARPVMETEIDPILASMFRVGIAASILSTISLMPFSAVKPKNPVTVKMLILTAATGLIGLGAGMTLLLFALSGGKLGIISTISSTTPVIILPLLWLRTGERPALGAWIGAATVVVGMGFIFW